MQLYFQSLYGLEIPLNFSTMIYLPLVCLREKLPDERVLMYDRLFYDEIYLLINKLRDGE